METARIAPATPPFAASTQKTIDQVMRGQPPLTLFTTLARDERLAGKFFSGGLLDKGHLSLRDREIVIDRTTARCGSEYEWGVHIAIFGASAGLTEAQIHSLAHGSPTDICWQPSETTLLQFCDALHDACDIDDTLWARMKIHYSDDAILELLMLAGFYRTVSYLTNALRLPLEGFARRFPATENAPA